MCMAFCKYYIQDKMTRGALIHVLRDVPHTIINKYVVNLETGIKKLPDAWLVFSQSESLGTSASILMLLVANIL